MALTQTLEAGLKISNNPSAGQYLKYKDNTDKLTWSTAPGGAALTGSTNNTLVTVTGTDAIQGEANLTYDGDNLALAVDANGEGVNLTATGNFFPEIEFNSNRAAADNTLANLNSKWNNTEVASIAFNAGADTTNKDDAYITFNTASAGTNTERLRITTTGSLGTNSTVRSANGGLDLCSQGATDLGTLTLGASGGQNGITRSDNTENQFRIMMPTFADSSKMATVLFGSSGSGGHDLHYGGGTGWAFASNTHKFFTAANATTGTGTERLRITNDGKVGIGETVPSQELHVGGDIQVGFATPTDAGRQLIFNSNRGSAGDTLANINWQWNSKNVAQIRGIAGSDTTNKDNGHLAFFTSSANSLVEAARIDSARRLIIGHTESTGQDRALQIIGTTSDTSSVELIKHSADGAASLLDFSKSRNATKGSNTIVQDDDTLGSIIFRGDDGTDLTSVAASIVSKVDGTPGANDMPGRLEFRTTPDGGNNSTARMIIDSSGRVGINQVPTRELSLHSPDNNNALIHFTNDDTGETDSDGILIGLDGNEDLVINNQESGKNIKFFNNSEVMRIDSSGNVGIGTTSPGQKFHVKGLCQFETTNSTNHWINYAHTDDTYRFNYNGSGSDEVILDSGGNVTINDGDLVIGTSGHGIDFSSAGGSATGSTGSLLDDYEEGSWTPTVAGGINGTPAYSYQRAWYVKSGNFVHASFFLRFTSNTTGSQGNSGSFSMAGLPFATANTLSYNAGGVITYTTLTWNNTQQKRIWSGTNATNMEFYYADHYAANLGTGNNASKDVYGYVVYRSG